MRTGKIVSLVLGTTMTLTGIYGISRDSTTAKIIGVAGCAAGMGLMVYSFSSRKRQQNDASSAPSGSVLDWMFLDGFSTSETNESGFHGFGGGSFGGGGAGGAGGDWGSDDGDGDGGGDDFKPPQRSMENGTPRMRSFRTKGPSPRF